MDQSIPSGTSSCANKQNETAINEPQFNSNSHDGSSAQCQRTRPQEPMAGSSSGQLGAGAMVTGNCGYTYNPPSAKAPTEIMTAGEITIKAKTPAEGRAKTQVKDNIDAPFPHNGER